MIGYGTKFYRSPDDITYTQVANLLSFTPPEKSRSSIDNTTLDGTDLYKTFEPGMIDAGEVSLQLVWNQADAQQDALDADFESSALVYYRIKYPNDVTVDYYGFITGIGGTVEIEGRIAKTVKFKISGKPVVTEP